MNAPLPDEVSKRLKRMEYDNYVTIYDDEGNAVEIMKIMGD